MMRHVWSPDSKWIAYTLNTKAYIQTVYAYSIEQDKSFAITDGLSEVSEPIFDAGGKYLYFFGSTDAGPVKQWFDMSNADMRLTRSLYLAVLRKNIPSPLAKESDEEKGPAKKDEKPKAEMSSLSELFAIDFDGIQYRILTIPLPAGEYSQLQAGLEGQFYYVKTVPSAPPAEGPPPPAGELHRYDTVKRKDETILSGLYSYEVSGDNNKILYAARDSLSIVPAGEKPENGKGKLNTDAIEMRIDPRAEWPQNFDRHRNTRFYRLAGLDLRSSRAAPDLRPREPLWRDGAQLEHGQDRPDLPGR